MEKELEKFFNLEVIEEIKIKFNGSVFEINEFIEFLKILDNKILKNILMEIQKDLSFTIYIWLNKQKKTKEIGKIIFKKSKEINEDDTEPDLEYFIYPCFFNDKYDKLEIEIKDIKKLNKKHFESFFKKFREILEERYKLKEVSKE
jgi:hypothetical protein